MANTERQMPEHIGAAYRDAVDNLIFLKRQQWVATKLRFARICGYFRNLSSVLSANRFCTKFAWHYRNRRFLYPLVHDVLIPERD
jgi:hypothetical protein